MNFKKHFNKVLYHGSVVSGIKIFKPNKRSCPDTNVKPAIYATDIPALAVGFSFLWESSEGFDIYYKSGITTFVVPQKFKSRLDIKIYIYEFDAFHFSKSRYEPLGHNFLSYDSVKPLKNPQMFNTVYDGMSHFGGKIVEI